MEFITRNCLKGRLSHLYGKKRVTPALNLIMTKFHTPIFFIVVGKMIDQKCLSNRLGITYSSTYHARDAKSILQLGNKYMYRKRLFNFQFTPSEIHIQKNNNNNGLNGRVNVFLLNQNRKRDKHTNLLTNWLSPSNIVFFFFLHNM